jgi:2-polyprenyl-3-methyl-5-hydroxy-6-metoxy-1,4-benzoquinol methylase
VSRPLDGRKPERAPDEAPLFLYEMIDALPPGATVLDAGCGPGSWPYARRADLAITGFDVKFPPGPPPRSANVRVFRGDLARLPLREQQFDLTVCHYVLEHVTELERCCDELVRVTRRGGALYLSVPRSASFDDRLYRFAGYFAKYALGKFGKRIEHQQRFDLTKLLALFQARGMELVAHARVPAGFSWMNDARTKPLQRPFTDTLAWLHRASGFDLAYDANYVLHLRRTGVRGLRRVTHVCRDCGEHSIVDARPPWPERWRCPWCGRENAFGRPRGGRDA